MATLTIHYVSKIVKLKVCRNDGAVNRAVENENKKQKSIAKFYNLD